MPERTGDQSCQDLKEKTLTGWEEIRSALCCVEELRKNGNQYARVEVTEQREDSSLRITFRTPAELEGYLRSRVRKMLLEGVGDTLSVDEVGKVSEIYARLNEMTNVHGWVLLDRGF